MSTGLAALIRISMALQALLLRLKLDVCLSFHDFSLKSGNQLINRSVV
jgi:hypothetical protein